MTRCKTFATTIAVAASAIFAGGAAMAQVAMPASGAGSGMASKSGMAPGKGDQQFATEAAKGGMAEVALGKLAQEKGGSDAVKQFGARMVEDHTKANDELKQIATAKSITLPTEPPKDAAAMKLESMSGNGFDRAYMAKMLTDHKKTVALFEKESRSGADPEMKAFATKTLPTLQSHLQMVQAGISSGGAMKH